MGTVFGKVVGDTIFNMIRLAEGHLEDGDRPKYPHKILRTRVLINPFPDIVPREAIHQELDKGKRSKPKSNMKATKDFKLLSFGEEAEDEEESMNVSIGNKKKGKSAHDLGADPKLLSSIDKSQLGIQKTSDSDSNTDDEKVFVDEKLKEKELNTIKDKFLKRKAEKEMMDIRTKLKKTDEVEEFLLKERQENKDEFDGEYECPLKKERLKRKMEIQEELKALTKELKPKRRKEVDKNITEKNKQRKNLIMICYWIFIENKRSTRKKNQSQKKDLVEKIRHWLF